MRKLFSTLVALALCSIAAFAQDETPFMSFSPVNGSPRKRRKAAPEGMVEVEAVGIAVASPKATGSRKWPQLVDDRAFAPFGA